MNISIQPPNKLKLPSDPLPQLTDTEIALLHHWLKKVASNTTNNDLMRTVEQMLEFVGDSRFHRMNRPILSTD